MNKPSKCKNCQWYGKPYWSIINPCDNCSMEKNNVELFTTWIDPTIKEYEKEIERLNKECDTYMKIATNKYNIINELEKLFEQETKDERPKDHLWLMGYYDATKDYLDKLKELKEKS